jgi:DNA mismatch repair protein MutL
MGRIHRLAPSVVNQIAAGEVIERPASVAKELLESAIDAGASRVELAVERGGRDLLRVADDGRGIERDDLPLAFSPHATSTLETAEDLQRVRTLGFRGEALAAIAEVSRVRCLSRTAEAHVGAELTIEAGIASAVSDAATAPGTVIEVRNLFFNTPVRRAFLKSDSTEAGHVVEAFTRLALGHPRAHFVLRSGGKTQFDLPATSGLKDRVEAFFGAELADSLIWVESSVGSSAVSGYVAHPSQSRSSPKAQYLFLHGRAVRDRSLGHALAEAYRGLLMVGRYPVVFLTLDLPPEDVDVNVHPSKLEVRFRDSQRVYSQVLATVRKTFLASDLHARLQPTTALDGRGKRAAPESASAAAMAVTETGGIGTQTGLAVGGPAVLPRPATGKDWPEYELDHGWRERQEVAAWFAEPHPRAAAVSSETVRAPSPAHPAARPPWADGLPPPPPLVAREAFNELDESEAPRSSDVAVSRPVSRALQIHDAYLVVETPEGLEVVDQHALHERILFEELRDRLATGSLEAQRLLVPEPVDVPPTEAEALAQNRETLERLGIEVEPFGGSTILIRAMPALLHKVAPERLVRDLAERLAGGSLPPSPDLLLQDLLATVACKAAVKAGDRLSAEEIEALLARRDLATTHHCPHGRPSSLSWTKSELERQFGRT